jgi:hypothetical protein
VAAIDWSVFDEYPENTIECRCGAIYRSHCKAVVTDGALVTHLRKPCPACGESVDNARRVSSDPETFVIGGTKT